MAEIVSEADYLTSPEVAGMVRKPDATLRYWRHIGYGPPYGKVGRTVLYKRSDVETWLEGQFAKGGAA